MVTRCNKKKTRWRNITGAPFCSFWKVSRKEVVEPRDTGSKPDTAEHSEVEALRSSTQVIGKEVKQAELRLHSAQQKLRDLNINIR